MDDYYEVLGVDRDATQDEIKAAFRRMARDNHPDARPDDPHAEERFRKVAQAYEILSDPQRRASYDRGETLRTGDLFSNFAGLDEILQQFFGSGFGFGGTRTGPERGRDVVLSVEVSLAEAAAGTSTDLTYAAAQRCDMCAGSGSEPGYEPVTCATCNGHGQVQARRNTLLGQMMTVTTCATCSGRGRIVEVRCHQCMGRGLVQGERTITVEIPAGVDDGTRLRLTGRGADGGPDAPPGDVYVGVRVLPDERFERTGADLHHRLRLGMAEAALGADVEIPTVDGDPLEIDIPPSTQPGTVFRIPRRGMPRLRRRGRGDLLVAVEVTVPDDLTAEEEDVLRRYAELRGESPSVDRKRRRRKAR